MLCPLRERVGTGPLGWPFPAPWAPSAWFWAAQCKRRTGPTCVNPTTLTSEPAAVFHRLSQTPKGSLPVGSGGKPAWVPLLAKVGSRKMGAFRVHPCCLGPVLEVPANGQCGQRLSAECCPAWPSCQDGGCRPHGQSQGSCPQGGVGLGGWAGQHRAYFCNCCGRSKWKWTIPSYCCQRDVSLLLLWECGWARVWVCVFCFFLV